METSGIMTLLGEDGMASVEKDDVSSTDRITRPALLSVNGGSLRVECVIRRCILFCFLCGSGRNSTVML